MFCDPHRTRLGRLVSAQYVVESEAFCADCFSGKEPSSPDPADSSRDSYRRPSPSSSAGPRFKQPRGNTSTAQSAFPTHFTRDGLLMLLAQAKAARERDWVLRLVSFWHGLRASEAIGLTPENFADGHLAVQRIGGSLPTVQPLASDPDELLNERAAVESWLERHRNAHAGDGHSRRLFPISRIQFFRLMRHYGRAAGLPEGLCHPHVLRRSIAMQLFRQEGTALVREYLGCRAIESVYDLKRRLAR